MDITTLLLTFVPIFVAVDVLAVIPLFLSITESFSPQQTRNTARNSILVAFILGVVFIFVGKLIFRFLGITQADFMIAGGVILFIFSISGLLGNEKYKNEPGEDLSAVPLGTPLIVGPAVLTTLILLVDLYGMTITLVSFILNLLIAGVVLLYSPKIKQLLGQNGMKAFSKVVTLFLAAIAVMMVRKGVFKVLGG